MPGIYEMCGAIHGKGYRVVRPLVEGASSVFEATHDALPGSYIVRVFPSDLSPSAAAWIQTGVRRSMLLRHAGIAQAMDFSVDADPFFVVTEYLRGPSLEEMMRKDGIIAFGKAMDLIGQIAGGLEIAHAIGIIHGDLNPAMVRFVEGQDGRLAPKVLGFGWSHALRAAGRRSGARTCVAPEQQAALVNDGGSVDENAEGRSETSHETAGRVVETASHPASIDGRADQFSLAVIAYEMIGGCLPFSDENPDRNQDRADAPADIEACRRQAPPRLSEMVLDLPSALDQVLRRALSFDPNDRYPTLQAFAAALRSVAAGSTAESADRMATRDRSVVNVARDPLEAVATPPPIAAPVAAVFANGARAAVDSGSVSQIDAGADAAAPATVGEAAAGEPPRFAEGMSDNGGEIRAGSSTDDARPFVDSSPTSSAAEIASSTAVAGAEVGPASESRTPEASVAVETPTPPPIVLFEAEGAAALLARQGQVGLATHGFAAVEAAPARDELDAHADQEPALSAEHAAPVEGDSQTHDDGSQAHSGEAHAGDHGDVVAAEARTADPSASGQGAVDQADAAAAPAPVDQTQDEAAAAEPAATASGFSDATAAGDVPVAEQASAAGPGEPGRRTPPLEELGRDHLAQMAPASDLAVGESRRVSGPRVESVVSFAINATSAAAVRAALIPADLSPAPEVLSPLLTRAKPPARTRIMFLAATVGVLIAAISVMARMGRQVPVIQVEAATGVSQSRARELTASTPMAAPAVKRPVVAADVAAAPSVAPAAIVQAAAEPPAAAAPAPAPARAKGSVVVPSTSTRRTIASGQTTGERARTSRGRSRRAGSHRAAARRDR